MFIRLLRQAYRVDYMMLALLRPSIGHVINTLQTPVYHSFSHDTIRAPPSLSAQEGARKHPRSTTVAGSRREGGSPKNNKAAFKSGPKNLASMLCYAMLAKNNIVRTYCMYHMAARGGVEDPRLAPILPQSNIARAPKTTALTDPLPPHL